MHLVTQTEAARILGVTKKAIFDDKNKVPRPPYYVEKDGRIWIDIEHPSWPDRVKKAQDKKLQTGNGKRSRTMSRKHAMKKESGADGKKKKKGLFINEEEEKELYRQSLIAEMQDKIFIARIREEKAKQEEIKTAEIKKELAPIGLIKHFFSFSENMIQRLYQRPHEISPQLQALFMAGEGKKAVDLMRRELEGIIKNTQKELIDAIKEEGYSLEND